MKESSVADEYERLAGVAVVTNQPDRIMNVYCWYRFLIT